MTYEGNLLLAPLMNHSTGEKITAERILLDAVPIAFSKGFARKESKLGITYSQLNAIQEMNVGPSLPTHIFESVPIPSICRLCSRTESRRSSPYFEIIQSHGTGKFLGGCD